MQLSFEKGFLPRSVAGQPRGITYAKHFIIATNF